MSAKISDPLYPSQGFTENLSYQSQQQQQQQTYQPQYQSYQPQQSYSNQPTKARRINFIDYNSRYYKTPHASSWHYNRFAPSTYY